jgi:hypothetical protein
MLNLQIPEEGCSGCPFKTYGGHCLLFKEPLRQEEYYDVILYKPCDSCDSVRGDIKCNNNNEEKE